MTRRGCIGQASIEIEQAGAVRPQPLAALQVVTYSWCLLRSEGGNQNRREEKMRKSVLSVISIGVLGCLLCLSIVQPAVSKDLRWAYSGDVYGLDPYAYDSTFNMNFLKHIYDTLVRWDVNLKIEPCLATSWKVVEPSVCRFYLRQDVKFQNGNSFNADDVVASIRRATHPNSPVRGTVSLVKEARKVDDYTVDILFDGAYAMLLNCLQLIHIMDYEWMAEHKCLDPIDPSKNQDSYASTHANGTGPFMIESRQPDAKTVLVVNPNWWDTPRHNLTRIVFTPIKSDATRVAALLSGRGGPDPSLASSGCGPIEPYSRSETPGGDGSQDHLALPQSGSGGAK